MWGKPWVGKLQAAIVCQQSQNDDDDADDKGFKRKETAVACEVWAVRESHKEYNTLWKVYIYAIGEKGKEKTFDFQISISISVVQFLVFRNEKLKVRLFFLNLLQTKGTVGVRSLGDEGGNGVHRGNQMYWDETDRKELGISWWWAGSHSSSFHRHLNWSHSY